MTDDPSTNWNVTLHERQRLSSQEALGRIVLGQDTEFYTAPVFMFLAGKALQIKASGK